MQEDHDDWDCLDDFEEAGLVNNIGTGANRVYRLTDLGRDVASRLRGHKGQGGSWANFVNETPAPETRGVSSIRAEHSDSEGPSDRGA